MAEPTPISSIVDEKHASLLLEASSDDTPKPRWGGPRENQTGRPKGKLAKKTLEAIKVRDAFNQRVMHHADRLFNAQMNLAVGEQYLFVRITEGEGKNRRVYHEIVTDRELIKQYLDYEEGIGDNESPNDDSHYYYLSTKPANNMAIDSLLNRAMGKVPDKLVVEGGFFNQNKLVIEVIGERQDAIIEGELADADAAKAEADAEAESETGPSTPAPEEPASS